jgi:hypothetical protein
VLEADAPVETVGDRNELVAFGGRLDTESVAVHGEALLPLNSTEMAYVAVFPAVTGLGVCVPTETVLTLKASVNVMYACDALPRAVRKNLTPR